jgi:hypothetical protein
MPEQKKKPDDAGERGGEKHVLSLWGGLIPTALDVDRLAGSRRHADESACPGEGRGSASTTLLRDIKEVVDGGPSPAMTMWAAPRSQP